MYVGVRGKGKGRRMYYSGVGGGGQDMRMKWDNGKGREGKM